MKKFILYIHQLPQNIIGLFVILFTGAKKHTNYGEDKATVYITHKCQFGVSLGNYIIFGGDPNDTSIKHESGHQKQSLYLGWTYLIFIGLPSFFGNIFDRIFHRNWPIKKRIKWYYSQLWEAGADKLGGVVRSN